MRLILRVGDVNIELNERLAGRLEMSLGRYVFLEHQLSVWNQKVTQGFN